MLKGFTMMMIVLLTKKVAGTRFFYVKVRIYIHLNYNHLHSCHQLEVSTDPSSDDNDITLFLYPIQLHLSNVSWFSFDSASEKDVGGTDDDDDITSCDPELV